MPVLFCVIGYALSWLMLFPLWGTLEAFASLLISSEAPNFNANLSVSYDPTVANSTSGDTDTNTDTNMVIQGSSIEFPNSGEHYGQITCEEIGLDAPVYWYDSDEILAMGVGQSISSLPPGFGTAIVLAGHNTTYFACLQNAAPEQTIRFSTNYGTFEYRISSVEVFDENDLTTIILDYCLTEEERLVLYTCYPFEYIAGRKTQRLTVVADKISGPMVLWKGTNG